MKVLKLIVFGFLICLGPYALGQSSKHRLVILADMGNEPDEEQQMAHMLMCSNEFDLEGLIAVSGKYLHNRHRLVERQRLYPDLFENLIDGYEKVYENLKIHAKGYPEPAYLRTIVASGQPGYGMGDVGDGKSTKGSELLIDIFKKEDPRLIYIVVNAGSNTLAQALNDFKANHSEVVLKKVLKKLRVFENGAQDNAGAWICANYSDIRWTRSNYQTYAYGGPAWAWGNDPDADKKGPHTWKPYAYNATGQHQWALEHIKNHGALGRLFPLRQTPTGRLAFIEGGGTIPWLGLMHQGLADISQPSWGSWSGRFSEKPIKNVPSRHKSVRVDEETYGDYYLFTEVSDVWTDSETNEVYNSIYTPVWRWRQAYYNDFQCRMDWCVASFENANHHPVVSINGDNTEKIHFLQVASGDVISLDASTSFDPDGDNIAFKWWIYNEAGTYKGTIEIIKQPSQAITEIVVPEDASGKTIHIILEIEDNNKIASLHDYRRIVLTVE
ncbi:nucleoside hydrolase-like domain-containing protein [Seonamhaeicola sp. ML3]|uniref:nucleoside hydrolase-like domain-containing protein n=1 Tax=Seonamhaeicola sp. ML3 TaxID=2937786 RepID=UPI00200E173E|nr:nucleoside hydrolase-like domain-containing protein [Seonamhaeicola sp. ML3]